MSAGREALATFTGMNACRQKTASALWANLSPARSRGASSLAAVDLQPAQTTPTSTSSATASNAHPSIGSGTSRQIRSTFSTPYTKPPVGCHGPIGTTDRFLPIHSHPCPFYRLSSHQDFLQRSQRQCRRRRRWRLCQGCLRILHTHLLCHLCHRPSHHRMDRHHPHPRPCCLHGHPRSRCSCSQQLAVSPACHLQARRVACTTRYNPWAWIPHVRSTAPK
mmetsp:Transcript_40180/g.106342  ORF Transcript_40180/g.106342 Transcript_40180/m.106342 type:complete len:221 (+) Transcript_40180:1324-1986(+)